MQPLIIVKSESTPTILLDKETGTFIIIGKSLVDNAIDFYQPIINWFELYLQNSNTITTLVFELEHINSASLEMFTHLIQLLNNAFHAGHNIRVEWRYVADDADTLEAGIDYSSLFQLPFTFITLQCN